MANGNYIAMSAGLAAWTKMEVAANNIANINTTGYKRLHTTFSQYLLRDASGATTSKGYTAVDQTGLDLRNGTIEQTGNPLDVAIDGPGFFVVQTPEGERLTRAGSFHLSNEGTLVDSSGHSVLAQGGQGEMTTITAKDEDGPIRINQSGEIEQNGTVLAQLSIVDATPELLTPSGHGLYQFTGPALTERPDAALITESLEGSNVSSIREMISLIEASRGYQRSQKIMSRYRQLDRKTFEIA